MKTVVKFRNDSDINLVSYQVVDLNEGINNSSSIRRLDDYYKNDLDKIAVQQATDQLMSSPLSQTEGNWLPTDVIPGHVHDYFYDIVFLNKSGASSTVYAVGGNFEEDAVQHARELGVGVEDESEWSLHSIVPTAVTMPTLDELIESYENRDSFYYTEEEFNAMPVPEFPDARYVASKFKIEEEIRARSDPNYFCIPYEDIYLDPAKGPDYLATIMTPGTPNWNRVVMKALEKQQKQS